MRPATLATATGVLGASLLIYHAPGLHEWLSGQGDPPATLQRADRRIDVGNGALLAPPPLAGEAGWTFFYPSMTPVADPLTLTRNVWAEYRNNVQGDEKRAIPVRVRGYTLRYEPLALASMEPGPPRPFHLVGRRAPDLRFFPSSIPGLDGIAHGEPSNHPENDTDSYVAGAGTPYDVYMVCESELCRLNVFSHRSRFAYELELPTAAASHAVGIMRKMDTMLVSWAPDESEIARHFRQHQEDRSAPAPLYLTPPACTSPAYRAVPVGGALEHPFFITIDAAGNVFVVDSGTRDALDSGSVVRMLERGASPRSPGVWSRPQQYFPWIHALEIGPSGKLHIGTNSGVWSGHGKANTVFSSDIGMPFTPGAIGFDRAGSLYTLNFQTSDITKTTNPGSFMRSKSTLFATRPGRIDGMAVSGDGAVYVANNWLGTVQKISPGSRISDAVTGLRDVSAIALDAAGNLYVRDLSMAPIRKVGPDGRACALTLDGHDYNDIAAGPDGTIYATRSEGPDKVVAFIPVR